MVEERGERRGVSGRDVGKAGVLVSFTHPKQSLFGFAPSRRYLCTRDRSFARKAEVQRNISISSSFQLRSLCATVRRSSARPATASVAIRAQQPSRAPAPSMARAMALDAAVSVAGLPGNSCSQKKASQLHIVPCGNLAGMHRKGCSRTTAWHTACHTATLSVRSNGITPLQAAVTRATSSAISRHDRKSKVALCNTNSSKPSAFSRLASATVVRSAATGEAGMLARTVRTLRLWTARMNTEIHEQLLLIPTVRPCFYMRAT